MMMSATRRSARLRRPSPKSRKHSRRNIHDDRNDLEQQRPTLLNSTTDRADSRREERSHRHQSEAPSVAFKNGDYVADSGIDSGNGHAESDSPQTRLPHNSSSDEKVPGDYYYHSSLKEHAGRSVEASLAVSSDCSPLREDTSNPTSVNNGIEHSEESTVTRHRSDHKHRHKTQATPDADYEGDREDSSMMGKPSPRSKHPPTELSRNDSTSALDDSNSRIDNSMSSDVVQTSSTLSNPTKQQSEMDDRRHGVSARDSKPNEDADKDSVDSSSSEGEEKEAATLLDVQKQLDAMSVTSEGRDRKRKLEARLEQAKHSLASPHVDAAVEVYASSEESLTGPQDLSLLQEFRRLFQQELTRLRLELDTFRHFCCKQMEADADSVIQAQRHRDTPGRNSAKEDPAKGKEETGQDRTDSSTQTRETEGQRSKQSKVMDEWELEKWEDKLSVRQKDLHEYEKEILEVETMLNQRQAICERRQSALLALDEELQSLREDIFDKKENLKSDTDSNVERARKNW